MANAKQFLEHLTGAVSVGKSLRAYFQKHSIIIKKFRIQKGKTQQELCLVFSTDSSLVQKGVRLRKLDAQ